MWRAARALISCGSTTFGGASSPDESSNNLNNINDLKFYHEIRGNLKFLTFASATIILGLAISRAQHGG